MPLEVAYSFLSIASVIYVVSYVSYVSYVVCSFYTKLLRDVGSISVLIHLFEGRFNFRPMSLDNAFANADPVVSVNTAGLKLEFHTVVRDSDSE